MKNFKDRKFSTCLLSWRDKAFQYFDLNRVHVRVIDIDSMLLGEYAENNVRKYFSKSEYVRCDQSGT
jgi:hypothetical protein